MDFNSLLVHVDAAHHSEARVRLAARLAKEHGAKLTAYYAASPMVGEWPREFETPAHVVYKLLHELNLEHRRDAASMVERIAAQQRIPIAWEDDGSRGGEGGLARRALLGDLLILGQHDPDDSAGQADQDLIPSMAISSGCPLLAVPYVTTEPGLGHRVLVAWKATAESARALRAALPVLRRAEAVTVVSWGDEDAQSSVAFLERHGITAKLSAYGNTPQEIGELLLSKAADVSADLLVMGCYGHSRARELMLGGVTRTILRSMTLPVLMAH